MLGLSHATSGICSIKTLSNICCQIRRVSRRQYCALYKFIYLLTYLLTPDHVIRTPSTHSQLAAEGHSRSCVLESLESRQGSIHIAITMPWFSLHVIDLANKSSSSSSSNMQYAGYLQQKIKHYYTSISVRKI